MPALREALQGQATTYARHDNYAVDARGLAYTYAYVAIKRLGTGRGAVIAQLKPVRGKPCQCSEFS